MIKGEKIFTTAARKRVVRELMTAARTHDKECARLREQARAIKSARTNEELERIRRTQHAGDPHLLEYIWDNRETCAHCKTKQHGGIYGCILSKPEAFYCWKSACHSAFRRASLKDERDHPKLYAAAEKRAQRFRRRSVGYSRRRRYPSWKKKSKPKRNP